jgi:TP901 family phage tail tape measure protein
VAVATVDIQVNSQGAVRSLNQVGVASKNTQSALQKLDGVVGSLAASFAAGFAINRIISDVKELDTNIRRLGTVGVNVAKINPALSALSDRLGGVANKAELAAASYQAASAGFSDTAGNIRILEAATKAATGGLADNQGVTEVLVKTLNAYGMSGTEAYKVTDSISKAVELGNQEWSDYVSQLGRVASMAALSGVSLDEMNAFIASATKNGATAEVAFTGLSAVLTQLLQPTKESQTAAAKLGIQWNLMGLQTKGLGGLMKELSVAIDKDKEAAARMVGPTEAMRGAFAAASKDGKDFRDILGQIGNASGKTDADFQTMKGSLDNTFKALDTSFKNLSEALGKAFGPTLVITIQDITKGVNGFADAMDAVPQPVMNATGELIKLIAQMILVQKAIQGVIGLHVAFVAATTAITGSVAASGTAATGSATAFALYTTNARTLQAASIATAGSVTGLTTALLGLAGIGIVTVGINYVITQTGAVLGSASAAEKSLAARSQQSLAGQLKGKTVEERQKMLKTTQKNLANDRKLASTLALQIRAQDARAESAAEMAAPADRAKLIEVQARVKTNQARIKAITSIPLEKPKKPELPPTPTGVGATGAGTEKGSKKAKVKDFTEQITNSGTMLDLARSQFDIEGKILEARVAENTQLVLNLEAQKQLLQVNADIAKIKADKDMPAAQKKIELARLAIQSETVSRQLNFDITAFQKQAVDTYPQYISGIMSAASGYSTILEYSKQLTVEQQKQKDLADGVANTVGQGMTSAFDALISGSENFGASLRNIASGVLKDIAMQLLRIYVINQAINAISSFLGPKTSAGSGFGGFNPASFSMSSLSGGLSGATNFSSAFVPKALGGPVSAGSSYMVGERGPELFTPKHGGSIVPNNALGGGSTSVVVNVDASGNSNVQGDQAQAKQLGVAVSAAVQAELVKQQRPGGLLAGTRR